MFDHQIALKGLAFIGGIPEHIVKRAHLDAQDVMTKAKVGSSFSIVEAGSTLAEAIDADKTINAFAVSGISHSPGEPGDFVGIISRARWGG